MKVCSVCASKLALMIPQPQMLMVFKGCDVCKCHYKSSYMKRDILKQVDEIVEEIR